MIHCLKYSTDIDYHIYYKYDLRIQVSEHCSKNNFLFKNYI